MKVLLIDDDTIDRLAIVRTLQNTDLPISVIEEVQTADEGLVKALEQSFDIILLDYQLPPTTGLELLITLRAQTNFATSIVMLSHSNDEDLALRCIEAGAQDFVMKNEISAMRLRRSVLIATERYFLERKIIETHTQLKQLAEFDTLTGLNNRHFFDERFKKLLFMASRVRKPLALLLIDVDRFKEINDQYGHVTGDRVLQEVSIRLQSSTRESDSLFRIGGDEFAVIASHLERENDVYTLVQRILSAFESDIAVDNYKIDFSVSIGAAIYPECGSNSLELRKNADIALYRAKDKGRNQAQYYSKKIHASIDQRLRIENGLKTAIQRNELELHYQPQFNLSMQLVGAEALLRWHSPKLGSVSPDVFIPIAETSGLIIDIGYWVIETAIKQVAMWDKSQLLDESFRLAINVSPKQLSEEKVSTEIKQLLECYSIKPSSIELEITESNLITNGTKALKSLTELSQVGVKIAIDDFGTGYSSISHLKYFPIDIIKIDRAFIKDIEVKSSLQLFRAICAFASSLDYETVAEGIETPAQHKACSDAKVSRVQGYKYSKPITVESFEKQYLTLANDTVF
ncbi:EAL domain-containing protein [Vibrio coralliilyticus]|uniref:Diguanylate cyclase n=1 Tax=Vibrio coralliilyticus TaxID=190893 RepID=A0AAN0S8U7_9VIBR|nr:GGDEF domain-containing response regulator [Vibrio coralliilyticus]AIW17779.1 diguanylate cyclase [Vibrio coralliilyticus]NOH39844.1 EAL domain-containing protein [Vibrio coralliilyticus]